jgi:hypothetical protein
MRTAESDGFDQVVKRSDECRRDDTRCDFPRRIAAHAVTECQHYRSDRGSLPYPFLGRRNNAF